MVGRLNAMASISSGVQTRLGSWSRLSKNSGASVNSRRPLRIFRRSLTVMSSPLGTPCTYFETGSSRRSFPSCASSTVTAAVIVLVFEAIRKCVSPVGPSRRPVPSRRSRRRNRSPACAEEPSHPAASTPCPTPPRRLNRRRIDRLEIGRGGCRSGCRARRSNQNSQHSRVIVSPPRDIDESCRRARRCSHGPCLIPPGCGRKLRRLRRSLRIAQQPNRLIISIPG